MIPTLKCQTAKHKYPMAQCLYLLYINTCRSRIKSGNIRNLTFGIDFCEICSDDTPVCLNDVHDDSKRRVISGISVPAYDAAIACHSVVDSTSTPELLKGIPAASWSTSRVDPSERVNVNATKRSGGAPAYVSSKHGESWVDGPCVRLEQQSH